MTFERRELEQVEGGLWMHNVDLGSAHDRRAQHDLVTRLLVLQHRTRRRRTNK